jgi:hypothetical protein
VRTQPLLAVIGAAILAAAGCGSGDTKSKRPQGDTSVLHRPFVEVADSTIQGKWFTLKPTGRTHLRSVFEFRIDGRYSGESEFAIGQKRIESGTYTFKDNTLVRKQTSNVVSRNGKAEKMTPATLSMDVAWYSPNEFIFVGNEQAVWKRQP